MNKYQIEINKTTNKEAKVMIWREKEDSRYVVKKMVKKVLNNYSIEQIRQFRRMWY